MLDSCFHCSAISCGLCGDGMPRLSQFLVSRSRWQRLTSAVSEKPKVIHNCQFIDNRYVELLWSQLLGAISRIGIFAISKHLSDHLNRGASQSQHKQIILMYGGVPMLVNQKPMMRPLMRNSFLSLKLSNRKEVIMAVHQLAGHSASW